MAAPAITPLLSLVNDSALLSSGVSSMSALHTHHVMRLPMLWERWPGAWNKVCWNPGIWGGSPGNWYGRQSELVFKPCWAMHLVRTQIRAYIRGLRGHLGDFPQTGGVVWVQRTPRNHRTTAGPSWPVRRGVLLANGFQYFMLVWRRIF